MEEHPIEGLMSTAMESLQTLVEVNTIIGDPVKTEDGTMIIPVSKVGFGFAAGGSEFNAQESAQEHSDVTLPFGGGSGGGVSITPVAFLIIKGEQVKMIHLNHQAHLYEKLLEFTPQVVDKVEKIIKDSGQSRKRTKNEEEEENPLDFDI